MIFGEVRSARHKRWCRRPFHHNQLVTATMFVLAVFAAPTTGGTANCEVPSVAYPTIQSAVNDTGCDFVSVAAGRYAEDLAIGRAMDLIGPSSATVEIAGTVTVIGSGSEVHLAGVRIELDDVRTPSDQALSSSGGATVTTDDVIVVRRSWSEGFIFYDGFETGSTNQWSSQVP